MLLRGVEEGAVFEEVPRPDKSIHIGGIVGAQPTPQHQKVAGRNRGRGVDLQMAQRANGLQDPAAGPRRALPGEQLARHGQAAGFREGKRQRHSSDSIPKDALVLEAEGVRNAFPTAPRRNPQ